MDQHLGASITLSFALVVVSAIVLYQPEKRPLPPSAPDASAIPSEEIRARPTDPMPPVTAGEPPPEPPPGPTPVPSFHLNREVGGAQEKGTKPIAASRPEPERRAAARTDRRPTASKLVPVTHRQAREVPPHEAFTLAEEGETLRDVALRVYGSPDEDEALWRFNRDLIGRRGDPLSAGTLLRTP